MGWDNDKPANNRVWNLAAGDIRDNWDFMETIWGVDLASGSPWVDITSPTYGADNTGVDDSAAAIQAAIDSFGQSTGARLSTVGGTVFMPAGTYKITTEINNYSGVHIVGAGEQATVIACSSLSAGEYAFKNVNNARSFSYKNFTIDGEDGTTCKGGIYVGNASGAAGFTDNVTIENIQVIDIDTTNAIGLMIENASHVKVTKYACIGVTNGEASVLLADMTNTGVIHYDNCKFGESFGTNIKGFRIASDNTSEAAVSEIVFTGCFFGGTTRGFDIELPTGDGTTGGTGNNHRNITFDTCHFETDNSDSGAACMRVQAIEGLIIKNCAFHGNANTDYGILFDNAGDVGNVSIENIAGINLDATGSIIILEVDNTATTILTKKYYNIKAGGFFTLNTAPTRVTDSGGHVTRTENNRSIENALMYESALLLYENEPMAYVNE